MGNQGNLASSACGKKNKLTHFLTSIIGVAFLSLFSNLEADVSGTVYKDLPVNGAVLNTYGSQDLNELGVEGITVTVFDSTGNIVDTPQTTLADGSWSVTGTSGNVRVEYSNIPTYFASSPVNSGSNTTIQFVVDGTTDADLGLHDVDDYSDTANPYYVNNAQVNGSGVGNTAQSLNTLRYNDTGLRNDHIHHPSSGVGSGTGPIPTDTITINDLGSVWGKAFQKNKQRLFVSSLLQRHVGLANSPADVYVVDYSSGDPATASLTGNFSLQGVTPANGGANIDLGTVIRSGSADYTLPVGAGSANIDLDAFAKVGRMSYGDIDLDQTKNILWLVNLKQRAIISVDASSNFASLVGATTNQYLIDSMPNVPTCTGGVLRPWALKIHQGKGYLGAVCDAFTSQDSVDLQAYVLSFDVSNPAAGFTQQLSMPLNYARSNESNSIAWNPWKDDPLQAVPPGGSGYWKNYEQPILTDIEFDELNTMYIAFTDRTGTQSGVNNHKAISGYSATDEVVRSSGEFFRVCNTAGTFEVEGTGSCTATNYGSEFFDDQAGDAYAEGSMGAMAILKGTSEIMLALVDPHPEGDVGNTYWTSQGANTFSTADGSVKNWYTNFYAGTAGGGFNGKANGMGDIELITAAAPIEIGNRVWLDTNGDGVQDADEAGIAGVTVELFDSTGTTQIATAITNANGNYIFSNDPSGSSTSSHIYQLASLNPDTTYTLRIPNVSGGSKQAALGSNRPTLANAAVATDSIDSDSSVSNDDAKVIVYSTDLPYSGANNHTFDFGFSEASPVCVNHEMDWKLYTQFNDDASTSYPFTANITDLDGSTLDVSVEMPRQGQDYQHVNFPSTTFPGVVDQYMTNPEVYRYWKTNDTTIDTLTYSFSEDITMHKFMFGGQRPSNGNFAYAELTFWDGPDGTGNKITSNHASGNDSAVVLGAVGDPTTAAINVLPLSANNNYPSTFLSDEDSYTMVTYDVGSSPRPWTVLDMGGAVVRSITWTLYGSSEDVSPNLVGSGSSGDESLDVSFARDNVLAMNMSGYIGNFNFDTCEKVAVGNVLFYDNGAGAGTVNDGVQSGTEPALPVGVNVELFDNGANLISSTVTDANGRYYFDNLEQGNYYTKVPSSEFAVGKPLEGYLSSTGADSGETDDTQENGIDDNNPATNGIKSNTFSLTAGYEPTDDDQTDYLGTLADDSVNSTYDFGFRTLEVSIGSLVWEDKNQDGLQGTAVAEPRISGAKVNLLVNDGSGTFVQAQDLDGVDVVEFTTLANGQYFIDNLPEGEYKVTVGVLATYVASSTQNASGNADADGEDDSNIDTALTSGTVYTSGAITLTAGLEPIETTGASSFDGDDQDDGLIETNGNMTVDFGFFLPVPVIDIEKATNTIDADTAVDAVSLVEGDLVTWSFVITNDGNETLNNITAADNQEGPITCPATTLTAGDSMTCTALTGTAVVGDYANTATVTGTGAISSTDVSDSDPSHYKAVATFTLGDLVWYDQDKDGVQDALEPGVVNIVATLHDNGSCSSATAQTDTTDAAGDYGFTNLLAGTYSVQFSGIPAGWSISTATQGGDATKDSDANSSACIENITVGPNDPNEDMGIYMSGNLGDQVWCESTTNANTTFDVGDGDTVTPSVGISLYSDPNCDGNRADGTQIGSSVDTNASGIYNFTGLNVMLAGDANAATNQTCYVTEVDTADTDLGTCDVAITPTTYADELTTDTPSDLTNDFGFEEKPRFTLGDLVWYDQDKDGVQDALEPGVVNIVATLHDNGSCSSATAQTDTTDAAGDYGFTNLLAGTYSVQFSGIPAGWSISTATQGGDATKDSDANSSACIENITVGPNDPNEDMGIYMSGNLGDQVWCESTTNANTTFDLGDGDTVTPSVGISLYSDPNCDGNRADGTQIGSSVDTNASGIYNFTGLNVMLAGDANAATNQTCYVTEVDTADTDLGTCDVAITPTTYADELTTDTPSDLTNDFGFEEKPRFTLGDLVWYDQDKDGVQDALEPGVVNIVATLHDNGSCSSATAQTDTTDAAGDYGFTNLLAGTYSVQFSGIPAGWSISTATQGGDATKDSDANSSACIENITVGPNDPNEDMGIYMSGNLGDQVWCESTTNANTTFDLGDGDTVTPSVGISLYSDPNCDGNRADGTQIGSSVDTNASGIYNFTGLNVMLAGDANAATNQTCYVTEVDTADTDLGTCDVAITPTTYADELTTDTPSDLTNDFGFEEKPRFTLGDLVWYDQDKDGVQDALEPGVVNIVATLHDNGSCSSATAQTDTTDAAGDYGFTNLLAGTYSVQFSGIPAGWSISTATQGGDATKDSDANSSACIENITVGPNDPNEDMGIYMSGNLGDQVWCESTTNANTTFDVGDGDTVTPSVGISLYSDPNCDGNRADGTQIGSSVDTNASGIYNFTGLNVMLAGDANAATNQTCYVTEVDTADTDLGTCDVAITPTTYADELTTDTPSDLTNDFGFEEKPRVSIGNIVWNDNGVGGGISNDGIINGAEAGIPNVVVELYRAGEDPTSAIALVSTLTEADGTYVFDDLLEGTYFVHIPSSEFESGMPLNKMHSSDGQGSADDGDDDVDEDGEDDESDGVSSVDYTLKSGAEPLNETGYQGIASSIQSDDSANMCVDFGFRLLATPPPENIPTLSEWMLMLLALLLFMAGKQESLKPLKQRYF